MKKLLAFGSPLLLLAELFIFGKVVALLREPSDLHVLFGVMLSGILIAANYYLFRFVFSPLKNSTQL